MATKTKNKTSNFSTAKNVVKKLNNNLIDASFDAIETTVKTGEKWQKLTAKLIKKTEPLTIKQVNLFIETAESVKEQVATGTLRLKNLVGYDPAMLDQAKKMITDNAMVEKAEVITSKIKKEVSDNALVQKAEKITSKLKKEVSDRLETVKEKVESITEEVKEKFEGLTKDTSETVEDVKKTVKKAVKTTKKATVKKATKVSAIVIPSSDIKNDLKVIRGIGPKMEEALNEIGITSFEQLSTMTLKSINDALSAAGINTKIYNTKDWKAQSKIAIKGDLEVLSQWIKDNKLTK